MIANPPALRKEYVRKLLNDVDGDYEAVMTELLNNGSFSGVSGPLRLKDEIKSFQHRNLGNVAFTKKNYREAHAQYNLAIMTAPHDSLALAQAYNNRSILLWRLRKIKESLIDIEICLQIPSLGKLRKKLLEKKRHFKATSHIDKEKPTDEYLGKKFQITGKPHATIACASDLIKIQDDRVIASKNINPGDVISIETAYATSLVETQIHFFCHHCQKFSSNLIPCNACSFCMFCNEECRRQSWLEIHKLECEVIKNGVVVDPFFRLSLQTVVKAYLESGDWDQLMTSVRNAEEANHYIEGSYAATAYQNLCTYPKYNKVARREKILQNAIFATKIVQALVNVPNVMPSNKKERLRISAFIGKQIMFHCEHSTPLMIPSAGMREGSCKELKVIADKSIGFFPFTRLIQHSCNPNVASFGHDKQMFLVATKTIPKGDEIFMSYRSVCNMAHHLKGKRELFIFYGIVCKCESCRGNWVIREQEDIQDLSLRQQEFIMKLRTKKIDFESHTKLLESHNIICEGLSVFGENPVSAYYNQFKRALYTCFYIYQAHTGGDSMQMVIN